MRLSQIARKVSRTPGELLEFLKSNEIHEYSGFNSKIRAEHVKLILDYFPGEFFTESPKEDRNDENYSAHNTPEINTGNSEYDNEKNSGIPDIKEENCDSEDVELIRAPKVKLKGVKVVGKMELPEKSRKPIKSEKRVDSEYSTLLPEEWMKKSLSSKNKKSSRSFTPKRKLSYLERQKLEEQKKEKEKKERINKEKEKKRNYYQKNIQSKIQQITPPKTKAKKKLNETQVDGSTKSPIVHKNPIRKFWAWLNGAYDE